MDRSLGASLYEVDGSTGASHVDVCLGALLTLIDVIAIKVEANAENA